MRCSIKLARFAVVGRYVNGGGGVLYWHTNYEGAMPDADEINLLGGEAKIQSYRLDPDGRDNFTDTDYVYVKPLLTLGILSQLYVEWANGDRVLRFGQLVMNRTAFNLELRTEKHPTPIWEERNVEVAFHRMLCYLVDVQQIEG